MTIIHNQFIMFGSTLFTKMVLLITEKRLFDSICKVLYVKLLPLLLFKSVHPWVMILINPYDFLMNISVYGSLRNHFCK